MISEVREIVQHNIHSNRGSFLLIQFIVFISSVSKMSSTPNTSVVLVTGAANGIGRSVVMELAKLKYNIAAWDVDEVRALFIEFFM